MRRRWAFVRALFVFMAGCVLLAVVYQGHALGADFGLAWDANSEAVDGYRIFRRMDGAVYDYTAPYREVDGETLTADAECPAGETCFFVARAWLGDNESGDSNEVSFTAPTGDTPGSLAGFTLKMEDKIMYLITDPMAESDGVSEGADYFEVEIDGAITRSDGESDGNGQIRLHHSLDGLAYGSHTARARAVNSWGEGEWTAPLSFTASLPGQLSGFGLSDD